MITDVHTHNLDADEAIISVEPHEFDPRPGKFYSVGIHPWSERHEPADVELLERLAGHEQVVAIGECGIDLVRAALPPEEQYELLRLHASIAERWKKPLVVHMVRSAHLIMRLLREMRPGQTWIIHGFRGGPELARQLLRFPNVNLSFGSRYKAEAFLATPPSRRLHESDTDFSH